MTDEITQSNSSPHVLIVDDLPGVRTVLRAMLQKTRPDLAVTEAAGTRDALTLLTNTKPLFNAVICDIEMPDSSGLELLSRIRGDSRFKHVPVILLSLEADASAHEKWINQGATAVLTKPFTDATLRDCLEMAL